MVVSSVPKVDSSSETRQEVAREWVARDMARPASLKERAEAAIEDIEVDSFDSWEWELSTYEWKYWGGGKRWINKHE